MVSNKPVGSLFSINDRQIWKSLAEKPSFEHVVELATKTVKKKLPMITDELFLEFSKNGNRTRWQDANNKYKSRLRILVLAECIDDKGLFLGEIENLISHC